MKLHKLMVAAMGAAALGFATLTLTMDSTAQGGIPPQGPPGAGPRGGQGFPGQPGQPGQFPGAGGGQLRQLQGFGGGGGGTAMDSDNSFLYIVQGNMLFKVAKSDLKILTSTPLMQFQRGDFPAPGQGPGRPGGGPPPPGGAPPPADTE